MAGIKRSHDTTLAEDVALSSHLETAYAEPRLAQPDGNTGSRIHKRPKLSPAASEMLVELPDRYVQSERRSVSTHVAEAVSDAILGREDEDMNNATAEAEDADMSDGTLRADDKDDHTNQQGTASQASTTSTMPHDQPAQFVPLTLIQAFDAAKNFAPTDATIRQNYLNEVGQK
jgi:hypothetical protein